MNRCIYHVKAIHIFHMQKRKEGHKKHVEFLRHSQTPVIPFLAVIFDEESLPHFEKSSFFVQGRAPRGRSHPLLLLIIYLDSVSQN